MSAPQNTEPDSIELFKALLRTLDPRSESLAFSVLPIPAGLIFILVSALSSPSSQQTMAMGLIGASLLCAGFLFYPLKLAQVIKLHLPVYTSFQAYLSALGLLTTVVGLLAGLFSLAFEKQFEATGMIAGVSMCALAEYLSRRHQR